VSYKSNGHVLVIGPAEAAVQWAERLAGELEVSVLITTARGGDLPLERRYPVWSGKVAAVKGWLGAFEVEWEQTNPIDLDVCTRCNACIRACPEQAIDFTYQIDLDKCKAHRACVKACGPVKAIDFGRVDRARKERFDLVLDLSAEPILKVPRKPQGYLAPGRDPLAQALAAAALAKLVGEFEKPKFFVYSERLCAHGRSAKIGCTAETLRRWVRRAERDSGQRDGLTTAEQQRIKELEREVRELRKANEILKLASAFFAQAELDRRFKL